MPKTTLKTLDDLLVEQLRDLLDAEHRLTKALPKMEKAATNADLKTSLRAHLAETKIHIRRLEEIFQSELNMTPRRKTCEGIKGLLKEGEEFIRMKKKDIDDDVRDAALIASAQRVEHYEIAGYGCVRTFAEQLGYTQAVELLQTTLDEERETDRKLTDIAQKSVNSSADVSDSPGKRAEQHESKADEARMVLAG